MSVLTDLEAALVAKEEADRGTQAWHNARFKLMDMLLNTEDNIAALVAVACRAREHMEAWDSMEEAVNERHRVLYEEQHGQFVSDQWKAELSAAIREANAVEHRTAEALAAALTPLVKEADGE